MRLIDTDALKQTIGSYNPIKYTYEYGSVITVADIDTAPTIEAEPVKKGKWTRKESKRMYWYVCSECGGGCPCNGYGQDMFTEWCPNCGARMESDDATN